MGLAIRFGRWRILAMLLTQGGIAIATGIGFASLLAVFEDSMGGESEAVGISLSPAVLISIGIGSLILASAFDFVGTTLSFRLRWRIQNGLRDEIFNRVRNRGTLQLSGFIRPDSTIGVASAVGIGAAHTGWLTQLLLNGLLPLGTACFLSIVVSFRAPVLLLALAVMTILTIPLVWIQVRRVSAAASTFLDSASEMSRESRAIAVDAIESPISKSASTDAIDRFQAARFQRMQGVQWLRLGTGILLAFAVGASVLGLRYLPMKSAELVIFIALLREAFSGIAGVARASGAAARIQPKAEALRQTMRPTAISGCPRPSMASIAVHGLVPPDWLARVAAVGIWSGGRPAGGVEIDENDGVRARFSKTDKWIEVWGCGRVLEDPADVHLVIRRDGSVVVWNPDQESSPLVGLEDEESAEDEAFLEDGPL